MNFNKDIYNNDILESDKSIPLTTIEKNWLSQVLQDEKIGLFLDEEAIGVIKEELGKTQKVFDENCIKLFDKNLQGDDFKDPYYKMNFQEILKGIKDKKVLKLEYFSRNGNCLREEYLPYKIEYNKKENRFKVLAFLMQDGSPVLAYKINISRIQSISPMNYHYYEDIDVKKLIASRKNSEPVVITTNQSEEYIDMLVQELSKYDSQINNNIKRSNNIVEITINYDKQDEHELLTELLSYGSAIKVLGNSKFLEKLVSRVNRQYNLMFGKNVIDEGK